MSALLCPRQGAIFGTGPEVVAKQEIRVNRRIASLEDMHVDVTGRCTHEAVPRLAHSQFVAGGQE